MIDEDKEDAKLAKEMGWWIFGGLVLLAAIVAILVYCFATS